MSNNMTGSWAGSLDDSGDYSQLVGDLVQMGGYVTGAWEERHVNLTPSAGGERKSDSFQSRLSGHFNGATLVLNEERNDQRRFLIRGGLDRNGRVFRGDWKSQGGKKWRPIKLVRQHRPNNPAETVSTETTIDILLPII
jgi:hypothetical protein